MAAVDWSVAAVPYELRRLDLEGNTLVIFTSGNGGHSKESGCNLRLRDFKGSTWKGGLRVPGIFRWPGDIPADSSCGAVATAMDFLHTFWALVARQPPVNE